MDGADIDDILQEVDDLVEQCRRASSVRSARVFFCTSLISITALLLRACVVLKVWAVQHHTGVEVLTVLYAAAVLGVIQDQAYFQLPQQCQTLVST
jgi:hypothetical protein